MDSRCTRLRIPRRVRFAKVPMRIARPANAAGERSQSTPPEYLPRREQVPTRTYGTFCVMSKLTHLRCGPHLKDRRFIANADAMNSDGDLRQTAGRGRAADHRDRLQRIHRRRPLHPVGDVRRLHRTLAVAQARDPDCGPARRQRSGSAGPTQSGSVRARPRGVPATTAASPSWSSTESPPLSAHNAPMVTWPSEHLRVFRCHTRK